MKSRPSGIRITRRRFLQLSACGVTAGVAGDAFLWEPLFPEIASVEVKIAGLPDAFDGYRILHMTDFHHSSIVPIAVIEKTVEKAREWPADLIALTGDFVTADRFQWTDGAGFAEPCIRALSRLTARDGVYAVLGNHDHEVGADLVSGLINDSTVNLLVNGGLRIERDGASIWLGGVDDFWRGESPEHSLGRALAGRRAGESSIVLAHQPDQWFEFGDHGVSLALCGHTHGGQIRFPFSGAPFVPSRFGDRFAHGLFREGATQMFVSRGIGTLLVPARMLCRSEIVRIQLRSS